MRRSSLPPGTNGVTIERTRRAAAALLLVFVAACTATEADPTTASTDGLTSTTSGTTTTVRPAPQVDVGVDVEAGIIRLALLGDISDDLWTGHFAYWDSVNDDLGGVGGTFTVELVRVATADEARELGALAVSLDESDGSGSLGDMAAMASRGLRADPERIRDVTRVDAGPALEAARRALSDGSLGYELSSYGAELLVADTECTQFGDTLDIDRVDPNEITAGEEPAVVYVCVEQDQAAAVAAAALSARPGSLLVFGGASWRPELAELLAGSDVIVAGYVPGPGTDGAPAAEVMALLLGPGPWSGDLIDGYTAALSMHAELEAALDAGDLTQASIGAVEQTVTRADVGFGAGIAIGQSAVSEPTGVRFVMWWDA